MDTNILVRFVVRDDLRQGESVKTSFAISQKKGKYLFISNVVVLELLYVLESVYDYTRVEIVNAINALLKNNIFKFENHNLLSEFINLSKTTNLELSDLLVGLISKHAGCRITITFDKLDSKFNLFKLLS
ncbi:MAG TPA: PIN domain-containing protein [Spirochaetota bacterium]|nr:PIN domain-containing protein [Spirochaetota bacterium]HPP50356.1 PIN domain-containing protein [Spirochaetota bacterium]